MVLGRSEKLPEAALQLPPGLPGILRPGGAPRCGVQDDRPDSRGLHLVEGHLGIEASAQQVETGDDLLSGTGVVDKGDYKPKKGKKKKK